MNQWDMLKCKALNPLKKGLMDEFTSLGKVSILNKGIAYIAGYGLRMLPIIQSPSQLVDVYGRDAAQTFQSNHAVSIIFPPKAQRVGRPERSLNGLAMNPSARGTGVPRYL